MLIMTETTRFGDACILDTDDMVVERISHDNLHECIRQGLKIIGVGSSAIKFVDLLDDMKIGGSFRRTCKEKYSYCKFYIEVTAEMTVNETPFQKGVFSNLYGDGLSPIFLELYENADTVPKYTQKTHLFGVACYFVLKNKMFITDGVDLIICSTNALDKMIKKSGKLLKASILQKLEPDYVKDCLLISKNCENLTLFSGLKYSLQNYVEIRHLILCQGTRLNMNGYNENINEIEMRTDDIKLLLKLLRNNVTREVTVICSFATFVLILNSDLSLNWMFNLKFFITDLENVDYDLINSMSATQRGYIKNSNIK